MVLLLLELTDVLFEKSVCDLLEESFEDRGASFLRGDFIFDAAVGIGKAGLSAPVRGGEARLGLFGDIGDGANCAKGFGRDCRGEMMILGAVGCLCACEKTTEGLEPFGVVRVVIGLLESGFTEARPALPGDPSLPGDRIEPLAVRAGCSVSAESSGAFIFLRSSV